MFTARFDGSCTKTKYNTFGLRNLEKRASQTPNEAFNALQRHSLVNKNQHFGRPWMILPPDWRELNSIIDQSQVLPCEDQANVLISL